MLLLDLTHTSHTRARTGIQRVARALHQHLAGNAEAITRDPHLKAWRPLESWEKLNLANSRGGEKRKAQWPASAKWRGRMRRLLGRSAAHALRGTYDGLIEPELFGAPVGRDFAKVFAHVRGPRIALFLDAIPLRFPELTPPGTVGRFPSYLRELLLFDGIAAISEESRDSLLGYWKWLGESTTPTVRAIPLGVDLPVTMPAAADHVAGSTGVPECPVVLCVGTLEGRKNHLALLEACERLWAAGQRFQLHVIGHVNAETGGAALARLRALQAAGRDLRFDGPATDEAIHSAYLRCTFTVYPSIAEGFGLPVIESLARGKPCVCSGLGALGEISRCGGCVPLPVLDASSLASAVTGLLTNADDRTRLARAAQARRVKSWADYTGELTEWIRSLNPR